MKSTILALALVFCLALSPACLAEPSSSDEFLSNLSKTWDSFLDMAGDAGKEAADWAVDSGLADWAGGAASDLSAWAEEAGLTEWAQDALSEVSEWYAQSGITEWAQDTADGLRAVIEENRPAVEAWLREAGEEVRLAWDTLTHPDGHTQREVEDAYEAVVESLEAAGAAY